MPSHNTPPVRINPGQLAALPPGERRKVEEALREINSPQPLAEGTSRYEQAWQTILDTMPEQVTNPLVARTFAKMPKESPLREGLFWIFTGAGLCFSSDRFDYTRKVRDFLHSGLYDNTGEEYLPLLQESLRQGVCSHGEVITILEDLQHIGSSPEINVRDLLTEIGNNYWDASPEFARAFLQLGRLVPFPKKDWEGEPNSSEQVALAERLKRAIIQLLPEQGGKPLSATDEKLVRQMLSMTLFELFPKEREIFYASIVNDPKIKMQNGLKAALEEWTRIPMRRRKIQR